MTYEKIKEIALFPFLPNYVCEEEQNGEHGNGSVYDGYASDAGYLSAAFIRKGGYGDKGESKRKNSKKAAD